MVRGLATVAPCLQMPPRGFDRVRKMWAKLPRSSGSAAVGTDAFGKWLNLLGFSALFIFLT